MPVLMIDYDHHDFGRIEMELSRRLNDLRPVYAGSVRVDRTAHGYHVRIWIDGKYSPVELNAIQASLGDDPERVRLNGLRIKHGRKPWNRLWAHKIRKSRQVGKEKFAEGESRVLAEMLAPSDRAFKNARRARA